MATKYLRGLQYTTATNGRDIPIFMRLCYEFWGYCVNGTSSLTTPGGMPTTPTSAPAGFFEGASVLATGTDGVTHSIGINFESLSANFSTSLIGKHITIWSPTDPDSTDNSIYRIVNVTSPTQLMLAPFSGGTRDITTLKNNLTSRSALNYRVIDLVTAAQLGVANGNYFVGTLSGASTINTGQASSQFQFFIRGAANTFGNFGILGSPAGTWTGSAFTGTTLTERNTAQTTVGTSYFNGTTAGTQGYVTLIADKDFFIGHIRTPNTSGNGMYFYIIVPQRLYTQAQDTNPMTILVGANNLTAAVANDSHSTAFGMVHADNVTRSCQLITRNFIGDGTVGTVWTMGPNLTGNVNIQTRIGRVLYTEALIASNAAAGQFFLSRAKMRPIAFTGTAIPTFHLVGDNGEFIHVGNGILWPWDGSILPYNLLPLGT